MTAPERPRGSPAGSQLLGFYGCSVLGHVVSTEWCAPKTKQPNPVSVSFGNGRLALERPVTPCPDRSRSESKFGHAVHPGRSSVAR
jgi:hypothetical protein